MSANECNLNVNETSYSLDRMGSNTRFEKAAEGNSKIACFAYFDRDYTLQITVVFFIVEVLFLINQVHLSLPWVDRN